MSKGLVASKVYQNASVLGLQSVREPLHMATAIISPCSKCHNPNCARNNPEMYESYSEETQRLFNKNSLGNVLPGNNPISFQSSNTRDIVMAFVALPFKNLFKASDMIEYKKNKFKPPHEVFTSYAGIINMLKAAEELKDQPYSKITTYIKRKRDEAKRNKELAAEEKRAKEAKEDEDAYKSIWDISDQQINDVLHALELINETKTLAGDLQINLNPLAGDIDLNPLNNLDGSVIHPWEVDEFDLIQCEPFPVKFMFSLRHAQGEFSGELGETDWITILYTGDAVYNGVFVPSAMYGGGLAQQVEGALISLRYPSWL